MGKIQKPKPCRTPIKTNNYMMADAADEKETLIIYSISERCR